MQARVGTLRLTRHTLMWACMSTATWCLPQYHETSAKQAQGLGHDKEHERTHAQLETLAMQAGQLNTGAGNALNRNMPRAPDMRCTTLRPIQQRPPVSRPCFFILSDRTALLHSIFNAQPGRSDHAGQMRLTLCLLNSKPLPCLWTALKTPSSPASALALHYKALPSVLLCAAPPRRSRPRRRPHRGRRPARARSRGSARPPGAASAPPAPPPAARPTRCGCTTRVRVIPRLYARTVLGLLPLCKKAGQKVRSPPLFIWLVAPAT